MLATSSNAFSTLVSLAEWHPMTWRALSISPYLGEEGSGGTTILVLGVVAALTTAFRQLSAKSRRSRGKGVTGTDVKVGRCGMNRQNSH